jgi:SAM-dependent methyltransferase
MAYEELKQRQSVMWGTGPYQRITETISDIHELVVERLDPRPAERWLDLACGTGAVAERAAARGAAVTGVDLAPVLIKTAAERATQRGLDIDYRVGDCERLDLPDASFDIVSSTCGIMFAPDHEATARELGRVTRPGGRLGLATWTPTGGLARMFKMMAPFMPAPPPSSPFDWGDGDRVRELLGEDFELDVTEHVSTLRVRRGVLGALLDQLRAHAHARRVARRPARGSSPRLVDFFESNYRVNGEIVHTREYLLVIGERR